MSFTRVIVRGLFSLALTSHAEESAPLQLVGVTQIDRAFTAYLRENDSEHIFTLSEGEVGYGWHIAESILGQNNEVVRIRLQRGEASFWLGVSGVVCAPTPVVAEKTDDKPLIDIPVSDRGPLHNQMLLRSRIKRKPEARAALREVSDLDPFATKLVLPAR